MSSQNGDLLEMELRALGRRIASPVHSELIAQAKVFAGGALVSTGGPMERRRRRRMIMRLVLILIATLPIPIGFLWADGAAVFSILEGLVPARATSSIVGAYLWVKVCALATFYGIGIPLLFWLALQPGLAVDHGQKEIPA
jgi:hypothetical protein